MLIEPKILILNYLVSSVNYYVTSYVVIFHLATYIGHSGRKSLGYWAAQNVTITNGNDGENHKTRSVINQHFEKDNLVLFHPGSSLKTL